MTDWTEDPQLPLDRRARRRRSRAAASISSRPARACRSSRSACSGCTMSRRGNGAAGTAIARSQLAVRRPARRLPRPSRRRHGQRRRVTLDDPARALYVGTVGVARAHRFRGRHGDPGDRLDALRRRRISARLRDLQARGGAAGHDPLPRHEGGLCRAEARARRRLSRASWNRAGSCSARRSRPSRPSTPPSAAPGIASAWATGWRRWSWCCAAGTSAPATRSSCRRTPISRPGSR